MGKSYPIIDVVGLEIESETPLEGVVSRRINSNYWKLEHDASIQSDTFVTPNGLKLSSVPDALKRNMAFNNGLLGAEIVLSPPYNTEQGDNCGLLEKIEEITNVLMSLGEGEDNLRSGIHFHISMPNSLSLAKYILRLGAHLEDSFFLLGGQGRLFRGAVKNESQYCRPITKWGPQCVITSSDKITQVFDLDCLLEAKNSTDFWWRYGNLTMGDVPRYHPARYTWLNLYSLWAHGSLEFRCFNTTLDPYKIYSELMFCKAFCQFAISQVYGSENKVFDGNSIYNQRSKNDILDTFQEFCWMANVPPNQTKLLGDIITKSPQFVLPQRYVYSHLLGKMRFTFDFSNCEGIKYIDPSEVTHVNVDDIHARHGER